MSLMARVADHLRGCVADVGKVFDAVGGDEVVKVTGYAFTLESPSGVELAVREGKVPGPHGAIEVDRDDLLRILEVLEVAQDPRPGGVYLNREAWVRDRDDALAQLRKLLT